MPERHVDQAAGLRRLFARKPLHAVVLAGEAHDKAALAIGLCRLLAERGERAMLIDQSAGVVPQALGLSARYQLAHVLSGERRLADTVLPAPEGFAVLPATRGLGELCRLGAEAAEHLERELGRGRQPTDVLLVNARSADLARVAEAFGDGARFLVVASSAPEGLTTAYADIKRLHRGAGDRPLEVLVTRARGEGAARNVFDKLAAVARRFAGVDLDYAGHVPAAALSGAPAGARWVLERLADACRERVPVPPEREQAPRASRNLAAVGAGH